MGRREEPKSVQRKTEPSAFPFINNRGAISFFSYAILPLLAYFAGISTWKYYDAQSTEIVSILSIIPVFIAFYQFTEQAFGTDAGQRFFVIALYMMFVFPIQNILIVYFAIQDGTSLNPPHFQMDKKSFALSAIVFFAFVYFFFFPDDLINQNTRTSRLVDQTDLKFFLIAGLFWFFSLVPYFLVYWICRVLNAGFRRK